MPSVCLYFQAHLPFQLHPYSIFQVGKHESYWDDKRSEKILNQVADRVYLPTNKILHEAIDAHEGKFQVAFSLSGVLIEQLEKWRPDILESFVRLADTGCVEFLSETYYHSLSFLESRKEFFRQVILHRDKIWKYFRQDPRIFCHTDLIYHNHLAYFASQMGYKGLLVEGVERNLHGRSPNQIYSAAHMQDFCLIPRNYYLSDDISLRFSDPNWIHYPVNSGTFSDWLSRQYGKSVHIFLPYETFGEYQSKETGILDFLKALPGEILSRENLDFKTPGELILEADHKSELYADDYISWTGAEKDLSSWQGNELQKEALLKVFEMEATVMEKDDKELIHEWAKLQEANYFRLMATNGNFPARSFLQNFSSPHQAYLHFMNMIADFQLKLR